MQVVLGYHFLKGLILRFNIKGTVWSTRFRAERRYDVSYFLTVSRLDKYRIITLMFEIIRKMFVEILNVLLSSFSNWGKVIIKNVSNIIWIGNSIFILRNCMKHKRRDILSFYNRSYTFLCIFYNNIYNRKYIPIKLKK